MSLFKWRAKNAPVPAPQLVRAAAASGPEHERSAAPLPRDRLAWFLEQDFLGRSGRKAVKDWGLHDFIYGKAAAQRRSRYLNRVHRVVEALSQESLQGTENRLRLDIVRDRLRQDLNHHDGESFEDYVNEGRGPTPELHDDELWERLMDLVVLMILHDYQEVRLKHDWTPEARAA